jgi:hypothetical protein
MLRQTGVLIGLHRESELILNNWAEQEGVADYKAQISTP